MTSVSSGARALARSLPLSPGRTCAPQVSVPELSSAEERCVPPGHPGRGRHRAGAGLHVHLTPGAQAGQRARADGDWTEPAGHTHTHRLTLSLTHTLLSSECKH